MRIAGFNIKAFSRIMGVLLLMEAAAMFVPMAVSLAVRDGYWLAYLLSALAAAAAGFLLRYAWGRGSLLSIGDRASFWITVAAWVVIPLAGMLPYLFTRSLTSPLDALFESYSGFTTTGSTVFANPANLPESLLVWRSLTQWIGGCGLVMFVVLMMRRSFSSTFSLYDAEFSGTAQRRLHPHIASSVRRMWAIYGGATAALFVLLLILGNGWIDSLCVSLSTLSTGGFMTSASGLAHFSEASKAVVACFMFLSGVNLAMLYNLFSFNWHKLRNNDEFRVYLVIFAVAVALATVSLWSGGNSFSSSLKHSLFHVASTVSTCGFFIESPVNWTFGLVIITFLLLFIGACTGSTGGGIKVKRIMIIYRYIQNYFTRMVHPRAVFAVKIDGMVISDEYINKVFAFVFMYIAFVMGGTFMLTMSDMSITTSMAIAAANICNMGPALIAGDLGVAINYASLPAVAKLTLMVLMLAGRIELFALVAIFSPSYWRRRK